MIMNAMTKSGLKISIIMPVYNACATIERAVQSVIVQVYKNWELIIINDCCPEDSCSQVENLVVNNSQVIQINNKTNQGVAISRNKGIAKAKGNVIAFLDADDYWHPDKLSLQIEKIDDGYDVVCSNYVRVKLSSKDVEVFHKEKFDYLDMLKSNHIGNLTGMYRCEHIGKVYQKNIGHEDYVMWLEVVKLAKKGYCIQTPLACYRVSSSSLSSNKFQAANWQWRVYRKELKFSLTTSLYFFLNYLYAALKKR